MYEAFISTQVPVGARVDDEPMFIAGPGPIEGVQIVHYEGVGDGSSFGVLDVVASGVHRDIAVTNPCSSDGCTGISVKLRSRRLVTCGAGLGVGLMEIDDSESDDVSETKLTASISLGSFEGYVVMRFPSHRSPGSE